jgi:hypothetical protein
MKDRKQCPKCLGEKVEFDPELDDVIECKLCKGGGKVNRNVYYDPIEDIVNDEYWKLD